MLCIPGFIPVRSHTEETNLPVPVDVFIRSASAERRTEEQNVKAAAAAPDAH